MLDSKNGLKGNRLQGQILPFDILQLFLTILMAEGHNPPSTGPWIKLYKKCTSGVKEILTSLRLAPLGTSSIGHTVFDINPVNCSHYNKYLFRETAPAINGFSPNSLVGTV